MGFGKDGGSNVNKIPGINIPQDEESTDTTPQATRAIVVAQSRINEYVNQLDKTKYNNIFNVVIALFESATSKNDDLVRNLYAGMLLLMSRAIDEGDPLDKIDDFVKSVNDRLMSLEYIVYVNFDDF